MAVEVRERVSVNSRIRQIKGGVPVLIRMALNDMKRTSTPITPKLTGALRSNVKINVRGNTGTIRWGQDYAWYQERGYTNGPVRRYTTAGTGAHFIRKSATQMKKNYRNYFRKARMMP